MKKLFYKSFLGFYLVSVFSTGIFAATAFAEVESCDEIANSHQEGSNCICDDWFKPSGGRCVPIPDSEACPIANTHREGDQCFCNDGMKYASGKCVGPVEFCAKYHATWTPSINDCKCNKGYIENEAGNDCLPVAEGSSSSTDGEDNPDGSTIPPTPPPPAPQTKTTAPPDEPSTDFPELKRPSTSINQPVPPPSESSTVLEDKPKPEVPPPAPATPPSDPSNVLIKLLEDPSINISNTPFVDAGLKNISPNDIAIIQSQKDAIQEMSSTDGEYQLPPTEDQKLNVIKGVIMSQEAEAQNKYEQDVKKAEQEKILKDPSSQTAYDDLQRQKESLAQQIKSIQDANNIVYKQSLQIMLNEQAGSSTMYYGDKQFNEAPKRDYMKETQGDPGMALVYANQAILANKKLIDPIKENLRQINAQQHNLLKLPEKPVSDLENKLKNINPNWYKTK